MNGARENESIQPAPFTHSPIIRPAPYQPPRRGSGKRGPRLRIGAVLSGFLLLVCLAAAWFVLTAKSLYIQTDPAAAAVKLRGGLILRLADYFLIRAGEYRLGITAEGYYPVDEILKVGSEKYQRASYTLRKQPGHLEIRTVPTAGAQITVDGEVRGVSPVTVRDLAPGEHRIQLAAERYLPHDETVFIEGRGIAQQLDVALTPAWAPVTVTTEPTGATVYVDDESAGQTPLTTAIMQGEHAFRVHLPGYKAWQDRVTVKANEPLNLPRVQLEVADATVQLGSHPARANVTVNGEYRGQTPLELALTPDEPAAIRLFREGYQPASRRLTLKSGEKQSVQIDLVPELTRIEIISEPPDAELYVDGESRGKAVQTVELSTQPHKIRVQKSGYASYEADFTPRPGIAQQIRVTLKSEEQVKLESVKPEIRTSAGQTLKLFRLVETFTLGASRREPGRRANESLREVRLSRPFYLAVHETTNEQYKLFAAGHSSGVIQGHPLDTPKQPVVRVSWEQAALYCNWLSDRDVLPPFYQIKDGKVVGFDARSIGYRLPTEAEWGWATRSLGGGKLLKFPWGDAMPPPPRSGNYADQSAADLVGGIIKGYQDDFAVAAPVGSFPANGKGLYDLGGNVAEWIHDFHDIATAAQVVADPLGPAGGEQHVINGASWAHGGLTELRLSFRDYGLEGRDDVGFRIARYLE